MGCIEIFTVNDYFGGFKQHQQQQTPTSNNCSNEYIEQNAGLDEDGTPIRNQPSKSDNRRRLQVDYNCHYETLQRIYDEIGEPQYNMISSMETYSNKNMNGTLLQQYLHLYYPKPNVNIVIFY